MSYRDDHMSALDDVKPPAGAAVAFTKGATVCSGYAIEVEPDVERYAQLNLVQSEIRTLFFVASTYGEAPPLNALCAWGGKNFTVQSPGTYAPDGVALYSQPVIAR